MPTGEPYAGNPLVRFGGRGGANQCPIPTPMCADETMKPTSESLSSEEMRYFRVVEGNCATARSGGEQSETKDQPQTQVNLIRPGSMTSLRRKSIGVKAWVSDEVWVMRLTGSPYIPHQEGTVRCCQVLEVRMVGRLHGLSQENCTLLGIVCRSQNPHSSGEASNDCGAKGGRKVNAR